MKSSLSANSTKLRQAIESCDDFPVVTNSQQNVHAEMRLLNEILEERSIPKKLINNQDD